MTRIAVAYLAKAKYGGWLSFTMHLCAALRACGCEPVVRTLGARTAPMPKQFGYGLMCRRLALDDLIALREPVLIAAADKDHADAARCLVQRGARIVVHDPAEKHLAGIDPASCIVIRQSMKARMPASTFIPHPYRRTYHDAGTPPHERAAAVCQARIDFDKHTDKVLEACDLGSDIRCVGAANPMYVFHKLRPRWPQFAVKPFDTAAGSGAALCRQASATVDMSAIAGDGGGSQYSFMEAWDAGSPLIINRKWIDGLAPDEMRHGWNCLAAATGQEIHDSLRLLNRDPELASRLVANGEANLRDHDPYLIGSQYREMLLGLS